ncbi:MAG: hypothetical protein PHX09_01055 [Clostridia bacterium]|nr:hypothetical protein [Clostridia bacterium]
MKLTTNMENFKNDIMNVLLLFFSTEFLNQDNSLSLNLHLIEIEDKFEIKISINGINIKSGEETYVYQNPLLKDSKRNKFICDIIKISTYKLMSQLLNIKLPWGCLTQNNPVKVARQLIESGIDEDFIEERLIEFYDMSEKKARLVSMILRNQESIIRNESLINLYINFCPENYNPIDFSVNFLKYFNALLKEINAMKKLITNKPYIVRTIYLKINSLSLLNTNELDIILNELAYPVSEFTIECEELKSLTKEKLQLLKNHGITRLSISPQSQQKQKKESIQNDIINFYKNIIHYDFKININIFAGLPFESLKSFKNNIDILLELSPENITIYSYVDNNSDEKSYLEMGKMFDYVYEKLRSENYKAYCINKVTHFGRVYEDIFYCKERATCIFNIDKMEETCSIIACGVNTVSSKIYHIEKRQEKQENPKLINEYLEKLDKVICNKNELFK